jgi:poly(glycerol-phosphate) alpha-glucosyltransferase
MQRRVAGPARALRAAGNRDAPMTPAVPRITMLSASLSRAGGGVYGVMVGQARGLSEMGFRVQFVGMGDSHSALDRPRGISIPTTSVRTFGRGPLRFAPGLSSALQESRADVVHLHGLWMQPSLALMGWRRRTGGPTLISPHGMLDAWALGNARLKKQLAARFFERANLSAATCLHALNPAEARAIRAFGLTNPVAVIPNGVDLPDLSRREVRTVGGDGRRVLLFLGRLHQKKGLTESLRAWARLADIAPGVRRSWRLVIAGWDDGGYLPRLRQLVRDLGLDADVGLPGPLYGSAKAQALQESDAFLLASHSEGLPMAVLEAWAYAKPVFMSAACNLPAGFAAGAAIEVVPEPEPLAAALAEHLARPDLAEIGSRGRALVEERFSWASVAGRLAAVYDALMAGQRCPDEVRFD